MVKRLSKEEFAFSKRLQGICNPERQEFGRTADGWYIWVSSGISVILDGTESNKEIREKIAAIQAYRETLRDEKEAESKAWREKQLQPKSRLKQLFDNARGWFA